MEFEKQVAYVGFSWFIFQGGKRGLGGSSEHWKAVAFSPKCCLCTWALVGPV